MKSEIKGKNPENPICGSLSENASLILLVMLKRNVMARKWGLVNSDCVTERETTRKVKERKIDKMRKGEKEVETGNEIEER